MSPNTAREEELDVPAPVGRSPRTPERHAGVARFVVGGIVMLLVIVLLVVAMGGTYYSVQYRQGPQPDGDDTSTTLTFSMGLTTHEVRVTESDGDVQTGDSTYRSSEEGVGSLMQPLRYATYISLGLVSLGLLAALLHRFGALNLPGPAPVLAAFGSVLLLVALVPFIVNVPHHARIDWVPGTLEAGPAFFTQGLDGTQVHDLAMMPGVAFWLQLAATLALPFGAVFLFWDHVTRFGRNLRTWAETAPEP